MFIIYDKDMKVKPLPQGVWPLDIFISSIQKDSDTDTIEGRSGIITKGSTPRTRVAELDFGLVARDTKDYRLLRDEIYSYLGDDLFYISEEYQKGKRYKVKVNQSFTPDRLTRKLSSVRVPLEFYDLPFAESIGTTQLIERNGINANDEIWGFGMGLIADDESLKYTHTSNRFRIYNAGIAIHPYEQSLKITLSEVVGSTSFLQLRNITNGSVFRVNEAVSNQTIVLDDGNVTSNGLQYFRKTNHRFIELEPGWNEFELTGATRAKVEFDFPFYYE